MGQQPSDEDPGWPSIGQILLVMVPGYLARTSGNGDALLRMRAVFISFSSSLVLFSIVLHIIGSGRPTSVLPWLPLLVAAAAVSVAAVHFVVKPLLCTSETELASSYRTRFFLVIALSEFVALFGFAFAFIGGPTWIYDLGAAFALVRFWTAYPPTPSRVRHEQAELTASGCPYSLVAALKRTPPPR